MRILVDENMPLITVRELREQGHDVRDVRGSPAEGVRDRHLWAIAQREERLLISTDKGFTQRRGEPHHGILIVRLRQPNREKIHRRVMAAMGWVPEDKWPGTLVTVRDVALSTWPTVTPSD